MRQRTWFLGHWRTKTDIGGLGRTLADIDGHWRTWTDISGLGRTMADLDGQWRTWTDIGRLGRTLADSDGHWRTQTDSFCKGQTCLPRSQNKGESLRVLAAGPDSAGFCRTVTGGFRVTKKAAGFCWILPEKFPSFPRLIFIEHFLQLA